MPDQYNFDHLTWWGEPSHRCIEIECGFPGERRVVPEHERAAHFRMHEREVRKERERRRREGLAQARRLKRQHEREEALIEEKYGKEKKHERGAGRLPGVR